MPKFHGLNKGLRPFVFKKVNIVVIVALFYYSCASVFKAYEYEIPGAYNKIIKVKKNKEPVITENNQTKFLVDAEEIMPEVLNVIDMAKNKIQISVYLFGGKIAQEITEKLIEKKKQGVLIQFIADPTMGDLPFMIEAAKKQYDFMIKNGIEVRYFPIEYLPKGAVFLSNIRFINHTKIVIADENIAVIGGMNFLDSEIINHDFMIELKGSSAKVIADIANLDWRKSKRIKNVYLANYETDNIPNKIPVKIENSNVEIAQTGFFEQSIEKLILKQINKAKTSINIEMLLFDHLGIMQALINAKKRGVEVKVLLEKVSFDKYFDFKTPLAGVFNYNAIVKLSEAGISVKWFVPYKKGQIMHGKAALVDNETLIIGSANFTYPAFYRNHEICVAVTEPYIADKFNKIFTVDWNYHSEVPDLTILQKFVGITIDNIQGTVYKDSEY